MEFRGNLEGATTAATFKVVFLSIPSVPEHVVKCGEEIFVRRVDISGRGLAE
jgi:hypothetical protein